MNNLPSPNSSMETVDWSPKKMDDYVHANLVSCKCLCHSEKLTVTLLDRIDHQFEILQRQINQMERSNVDLRNAITELKRIHKIGGNS